MAIKILVRAVVLLSKLCSSRVLFRLVSEALIICQRSRGPLNLDKSERQGVVIAAA
jgi:hypothetical protein